MRFKSLQQTIELILMFKVVLKAYWGAWDIMRTKKKRKIIKTKKGKQGYKLTEQALRKDT